MKKTDIKTILNKLVSPGKNSNRLTNLINVLEEYNINYSTTAYDELNKPVNVTVLLKKPGTNRTKRFVLGAHYDVYPDSLGINDNLCAVALLIKFIIDVDITKLSKNIEVVFFDKEETGMTGSRFYTIDNYKDILYAIVLDVIGYGNMLLYSGDRQYISGTSRLLKILPSDNITMSPYIKNTLIVAMPSADVIYDTELMGFHYNFKEGTFYESFHNRSLDNNFNVINFELLDKLLENIINHAYTGDYKNHKYNHIEIYENYKKGAYYDR